MLGRKLVEVRNGAFATPEESLVQIKATLKETIAAAIQGGETAGMGQLLGTVSRRTDEVVSDGGTCYFLIYFVIKTKRYSNVVFHGVA